MHIIVAALLVAPGVTIAAQDSTQTPTQDSVRMQSNNNYNQTQQNTQEPLSDDAIVMHLHRTNQMEIKLGQLAQRNGTSKVKSFASRLVKDHTANDQKVTKLARTMGVSLARGQGTDSGYAKTHGQDNDRGYPGNDTTAARRNDTGYPPNDTTNREGMQGRQDMQGDSTKHHEMQEQMERVKNLQSLHGAAFDTAFANVMVEGHQKAVSMLETAQNQVQNAQLRSLIASTLPTIRQHLQIAQSLSGTATTTSSSQQ
jgi:predicted outer membrane protein